jgi:hypothetical protein
MHTRQMYCTLHALLTIVLIEHYSQERHAFQLATNAVRRYAIRACDESTPMNPLGNYYRRRYRPLLSNQIAWLHALRVVGGAKMRPI